MIKANKVLQGEEYEPCKFFEKNFKTICPAAWIEKWDEQRDKVRKKILEQFLISAFFQGAFPANI